MDIIYFYSSKYIPQSIHLFAHSFNFFMPSRKAAEVEVAGTAEADVQCAIHEGSQKISLPYFIATK
jgi:hypothetical protein